MMFLIKARVELPLYYVNILVFSDIRQQSGYGCKLVHLPKLPYPFQIQVFWSLLPVNIQELPQQKAVEVRQDWVALSGMLGSISSHFGNPRSYRYNSQCSKKVSLKYGPTKQEQNWGSRLVNKVSEKHLFLLINSSTAQ